MDRKTIGFWNYTVILTYFGLISALIGIFLSIKGMYPFAIACLLVSGFCDMLDGTIASTKKDRTDDEKSFGMQIDSLCDLICFGALPAVFTFCISEGSIVSAACAVFIVLFGVVRLAYFNVLETNRHDAGEQTEKIYRGLPITLSALVMPALYVFYAANCIPALVIDICGALMAIAFITPFTFKNPSPIVRICFALAGTAEIVGLVLVTI